MDERQNSLDKSIKIIKEQSNNEDLKKMAQLIDEKSSSNKEVDTETLNRLGQYTYDDYSNRQEKEISK